MIFFFKSNNLERTEFSQQISRWISFPNEKDVLDLKSNYSHRYTKLHGIKTFYAQCLQLS